MSFLVRGVEMDDLGQLQALAKQFILLNLPADRKVLATKIEKSVESFAGRLDPKEAEFLFVIEDVESGFIAGSSQIIAKHGTPESPHLYFKVLRRNRMAENLGVGFMHKILRFQEDTDGPTEIGGLLVDRTYRRRPERLGRQISLMRFLYMAMTPENFMDRVLCELSPPLTEEGRSEFWEALGRRFTGMPYQEADQLSQLNKEFIQNLFPEEDIYLSLLDSRARLVMGQVGEKTRPAQHLLESIGFEYLEEVDPFDGGPHYGAALKDISIVKQQQKCGVVSSAKGLFDKTALVGLIRDGRFKGVQTAVFFEQREKAPTEVSLPPQACQVLQVADGDEVSVSVLKRGSIG